MFLNCIVGAIMACGQMASITIPGPVGYAPGFSIQYLAYPVPLLQPAYGYRRI